MVIEVQQGAVPAEFPAPIFIDEGDEDDIAIVNLTINARRAISR
jgi:hypothetical protein